MLPLLNCRLTGNTLKRFACRLSHPVALFVTLLVLNISLASGSPEKEALVTLQYQNFPLEKVIREIKKQTGYLFLYEAGLLTSKRVTIDVKGKTITEAMPIVLRNQKLEYRIFDKTVVIRMAAPH